MNETRRILDTLKRCLRARGMTYRSLGKALNLSESSVKRLFADESFTLGRLERVCGAIDMTVADLSRMAGGTPVARSQSDTLSLEQERTLARNPSLLACFYLLLNGHSDSRYPRATPPHLARHARVARLNCQPRSSRTSMASATFACMLDCPSPGDRMGRCDDSMSVRCERSSFREPSRARASR